MTGRPRRILMVLDHPFPEDIRVENEAGALLESGFEVGLLSIGPDDRPATEVHNGIRVFRNRIHKQMRNKMRGLAGSMPLLTWHVSRIVRRLHRQFPFDALHMHDLYLFGGGLRAALDLNVPVVGDLHENWVEALKGYAWSTRFPGKLFVNLTKWKRLEREWTTGVDRLIVVVEEAAERNRANGVDRSRIVIVSNTLNIDVFASQPVDDVLISKLQSPLHLVYVGGFDLHRGLDTVIEAMSSIIEQIPQATLTLVGDGRITEDLRRACHRLGVERNVLLTGWQPRWRLKSFIMSADICLVPHRRTPHTDATIPHKLFQYMYCAKPVIVSDCTPLRRIVEGTGAGVWFRNADVASLARAVVQLGMDPDAMERMGASGRVAVENRFNWRHDAERLVGLYDDLLRKDATGRMGASGP